MKNRRAALSKKTRFDLFKRDVFTCQYCGAHPPGVLLHVDHIVAVAAGGSNDIDNLVTACEACNQGKGARDLKAVPQALAAKAKLVAEREAQLLGYQKILQSRADRVEEELWQVAELIDPGSSTRGMSRDWLAGIKRFNATLGFYPVIEAADTARARYPHGGKRTFLYFCGICWSLIRNSDA